MTVLDTPAPTSTPDQRPADTDRSLARQVAAAALLIVAFALLGFAGYLGVVSRLYYDRAQHTAYANFRVDLAQATAPVGPTQPGDPTTLLTPGTPIAVLNIPELDLQTVVFEGTTGTILQSGPGHMRDTPFPGQAGTAEIMGRQATFGGPFARLDQLGKGDTFSVTTGQGVADYRVVDLRRAGDPQPQPLAAGRGRLILATADGTPFLPGDVLRVDADLITPAQPAPPMVLTANDLSPAEQAMHGDSSAWFPLVLWGQGLVLAAGLVTWTRARWDRWQLWIVAVPVLGFFGLAVAEQASRLLLNLM
jgi:sortase A